MSHMDLVKADKDAAQEYWAALDAYQKTAPGERGDAWKRVRKAREAWNKATHELREAS